MRKLIWGKTFAKVFRKNIKKYPYSRNDIEATLKLLINDPLASSLLTHKLKGKLAGSWACSAGYNLRIIFDFVKSENNRVKDIFLITVGTHEEIY